MLALSPHLDDAAFSCGGTLHRLAAAGADVTVLTVFTGSVARPTGFALACQTDKGLPPEVDYMALRREEDARALRALGARPVWAGLLEAPHRGYGSAPALFASTLEEPDLDRALDERLERTLAEPLDLLLAPQAIGGHVDHVQLVRAFRRARTTPRPPTLWWRDFPYDLRDAVPVEPFAAELAAEGQLEVELNDAERSAREAATRAYQSQLGFQFGGEDRVAAWLARAGCRERFRGDPGVATPVLRRG